jgi:hypothetical protein
MATKHELKDLHELLNSLERKVKKIDRSRKNMTQREMDMLISDIKYLQVIVSRIREIGGSS